MNKEEKKHIIHKYFKFKKQTIDLFTKQLDEFYKLENNYTNAENTYKVNDNVMLDKNTLIHGSRATIETLDKISKNGLIAPEFLDTYTKIDKNKKKPFVVEFWKSAESISLKGFIDKYCGVTIEVRGKDDKVFNRIISPIDSIEKEILNLQGYRDYIIYQNQEQRYLPNEYNHNATMAFIVTQNKENENLLKNDIFSTNFDKQILKSIIPKWFYKKYMKNRNFDISETGRERAIIYGIPACLIEGILVNREIEQNIEVLNKIKVIFPKCYICNIDGKVIVE